MNLCIICLRTGRLLNVASDILEKFHEELCDSVVTRTSSHYYCSECEYLLTKVYKFKQKCLKALKIYQEWKTATVSKKQPIDDLYRMLPPLALGMWTPNTGKIGFFIFEEVESQPAKQVDLIKGSIYNKEVKLESEQSVDKYDKFYVLLQENNSENVLKSENINDIKNESESEEHNSLEKPNDLLEDESEDEESNDLNVTTENEVSEKLPKLKSKRPSETTKKVSHYDKFKENDKQYDSIFDIEYLTTPEMKLEEFERRKTYECYVKAEHKCEICYQGFKSSKFLEYHTNKNHTERTGSVLCPICKTWYSTKTRNHKLTHDVVFKCRMCPLVTYYRKSMTNHFELHKGMQYNCEQCNFTCKSKSVYQAHMGKAHRRGRHVCECCGRGFGSPLGLNIHKNNSTRCTVAKEPSTLLKEPTEGVRCDECDVTLPSKKVYERHIFDVHEMKTPRTNRVRRNKGESKPEPDISDGHAHVFGRIGHHGRRLGKHTCRVCHKVGVSFYWLLQHFKREHPGEKIDVLYADKKPHLCDTCGTGFSTVYALRDHMYLHTGARPHACDLCPKRFRSAKCLRDHRVRHFPGSIPCTLCEKTFKSEVNLYSHMMTHTGEKKHKCDICGKGFILAGNLKAHVRGVHHNIRRVRRGGAREGGVWEGAKRTKRKTVPDDTETDDSE